MHVYYKIIHNCGSTRATRDRGKQGKAKVRRGRQIVSGTDVFNQIVIRKGQSEGRWPYGLISAGTLGNIGSYEGSLKRRVTAVVNKADRLPLEGDG
jgi:hypothetical protein